MDIRTMPAGPELDAELDAELARALGYEIDANGVHWVEDGRNRHWSTGVFTPSTDARITNWAAKKVTERGYTIHITIDPDRLTTVEVYRAVEEFLVTISKADGETIPLAATRAFILALREEAGHA
ncbi:hypothetical protein M3223_04155 [Paenibacillus pasadenensis]|uniref:hypothetical protein n=1 Tax=Paenibacillus pasadenensis TaxID=217090 RepID=UPI00203FD712|nr:hypothetical protein [Paenibacillus pasadenensis]MCM3746542.1 hypothetical protein [Paenibacillus pasadenensis]